MTRIWYKRPIKLYEHNPVGVVLLAKNAPCNGSSRSGVEVKNAGQGMFIEPLAIIEGMAEQQTVVCSSKKLRKMSIIESNAHFITRFMNLYSAFIFSDNFKADKLARQII